MAAPAAAALKFGDRCSSNLECAHLRVPLDRSGVVPGTIRLRIDRLRGAHPRGAVFAIAGGPGQGATPIEEGLNSDIAAAMGHRDLIVIDQRGTGDSGALNCPTLDGRQQSGPIDARTAACAQYLGPRANHYTTADTVADFEAVRQALGIDKITLYGISYGTQVALWYAATFPQHVERLVLDSVVDPRDNDPFELTNLAALPRVLGEICRDECKDVSADLAGDVARLADRLAARPLTGRWIDSHGRVHTKRVTERDLYSTIRAADLDPASRAEYPAAVHAALTFDPLPLIRMEHRFDDLPDVPPPVDNSEQVKSLSFSLQAATLCEEAPLPWQRTATPEERDAQAQAAAAAIPDERFEPFDRATTLVPDANNLLFQCRRWPALPQAPVLPDAVPDVPVAIFEGLEDTRTPLESGVAVASRFPHAVVVQVPKTAHAVLGRRGCARAALKRFFADRPVLPACQGLTGKPLVPLAPRTVKGAGGPLRAVERTLDDLSREVGLRLFPPIRGGGLRAGYFTAVKRGRVSVRGWSYVRRLALSGTVNATNLSGRYTVRGAAKGTLQLSSRGVLRGTLNGKQVHARWHAPPPLLFR